VARIANIIGYFIATR